MNKRRLLALADFLEKKVPAKDFSYGTVCDLVDAEDYPERLSPGCGAVGCAVGWALSMPCFKREGWRFSKNGSIWNNGLEYSWLSAGVQMFDLNYEDSDYLLTPGHPEDGGSGLPHSATPKRIARHIRKFVARKEREIAKAKKAGNQT
jgi:hypothetical protein